jgi:hypothetical protein
MRSLCRRTQRHSVSGDSYGKETCSIASARNCHKFQFRGKVDNGEPNGLTGKIHFRLRVKSRLRVRCSLLIGKRSRKQSHGCNSQRRLHCRSRGRVSDYPPCHARASFPSCTHLIRTEQVVGGDVQSELYQSQIGTQICQTLAEVRSEVGSLSARTFEVNRILVSQLSHNWVLTEYTV